MTETIYRTALKCFCTAICVVCMLAGCAKVAEEDNQEQVSLESGEEPNLKDGMKRLYLRLNEGVDTVFFPSGFSAGILKVNGKSHTPQYNPACKAWYVDTEINTFGAYSAEFLYDGFSTWYDGTMMSGITIPSVQFAHKYDELKGIPLFAEYDSAEGDFLDFIPPYAVLRLKKSGSYSVVSLKLTSQTFVSGQAIWSRNARSFSFEGQTNEVVLNSTLRGDDENFFMLVFGRDISGAELRVCTSDHKAQVISLGDISLHPGQVYEKSLDLNPDEDLLWFEGFDRCVWGGDIVAGNPGVAPSEESISLDGDDSRDGYEYSLVEVQSDAPGSGYVQKSFAQGLIPVIKSHGMSDSYIESRGFADNRYMLRCRECPGYISVGTGDANRGWYALYPLQKAGLNTVKNLQVSFRMCLHPSCQDDILMLINGSEDVVTEWYIDEEIGPAGAVSQKGTSDTLRLSPEMFVKGGWRDIRVCIDNCTDLTALHWLAASSESGGHGFYLDEISVREVKESWNPQGKLRIMYWNIQNGMWGDQPAYDNFVAFVRKYSPDICVWCEAKSNHLTDSEVSWKEGPYLPEGWEELAARYGHSYVAMSRRGTEKFPQVITSEYPVKKLLQIGDVEGGDPIVHGSGLFEVDVNGLPVNLLTIHLKPNSGDIMAEGERYRSREIKYILAQTLKNPTYEHLTHWLVLGDFNADSRKDAAFHPYVDDGSRYLTHDYLSENTSLIDLMSARYPGTFMYTTASARRIDYVYMDEAAYGRVVDACVLTESWTAPTETGLSNFYKPSDHRPILIDLQY